jgi:kinesin family member 21
MSLTNYLKISLAQIMAYGQTGSGKTFTMGSEAHSEPESSTHSGLIPRFMSDFFHSLQKKKEESDKGKEGSPVLLGYSLTASFLEVYGEEIFDLLDEDRKPLPLREDSHGGVVIAGLTSRPVSNVDEALQVLHEGTMNRTTAATLMNLTSSRSHAVFTINLNQTIRSESCGNVDLTTTSQFTFVDLAGSERMKKTGAEGERAREGIMINQGLLALGNVINALADEERLSKEKKVHVPYRQSKLTRLLQDALGGNSQTLFLACVSPSDTNASETLSTLHYANRARNIRNAPTKNIDATAAELQRLHSVSRVLQCELIKQKFFQDQLGNKENIGEIDLELFKRIDVMEYLKKIHAVAGDMQRIPHLLALPDPVDTSATPSKYLVLPPIPAQSTMVAFQASPGSKQVLDATPNKSISERFDDSFLLDANPIEDMAILDRLLELQQHDHEYDSEKKKDDEELKQVVGELEKQENMLLQLKENLKVYHSLKEKYEALMGEVQQLEAEKLGLAEQLERATADPSTGCSEAIKRKLETVELGLVRARNETKKHREKYRKAEEQAKKCQVLERKVNELKQGKVSLLKKQKEAATKYREVTERKTKELLALKRRERVTGQKVSKLEMEIQHHKSNLDKRKEYCDKLSSKLKQTESHLMKLLSMRSRELSERTSLVGPGPLRRRTNEFTSSRGPTVEEGLAAPTSEDTKSIRFMLFKMVEEKVNQANLAHEYEDRVNLYSNIVRQMVVEMKKLEEAKRQHACDQSEKTTETVTNIEEAVAELELKLELVSSELEQIRPRLPQNPEESRLDADEAVVKMMSAMSAPVLRTLLLETFSKYADVEVSDIPQCFHDHNRRLA